MKSKTVKQAGTNVFFVNKFSVHFATSGGQIKGKSGAYAVGLKETPLQIFTERFGLIIFIV